MKRNMSTLDRIIRTIIAVLFAVLYFTGVVPGTLGVVLLVIGVVFVLTAILGWCPIYGLFKLSTSKSK
jgi:hypothetical protein